MNFTLNPRPLSDFTVHATLSSPPFQSLIASFDLRFNNPKRLRLQIHRVNPFLNPSTTIYHSIRDSLRQGGVSSNIKRLACIPLKPSSQSKQRSKLFFEIDRKSLTVF